VTRNRTALLNTLWISRVDDDTPADDARLLLEALGLLTDDGIPADDLRNYEVGTAYDSALYGKDRK
jgi:hypothetical protein